MARRLYPVHFAFEHNVHQHQIGRQQLNQFNGPFAGHGHIGYLIPQFFQARFHFQGDNTFIFDNEYSFLIHFPLFRGWLRPVTQ